MAGLPNGSIKDRKGGVNMRKFVAFLSSVSLVASGCTPIAQELRNPGGYPGYVLDRHMFDASRSKEMHLLRAAIILAMASRMGTATVRDGAEADSFATYLAAASDELNYAAANVYGTGSDPADQPCNLRPDEQSSEACASYYALFESDMPMFEGRLVRLMLAALPESRGREFLAAASKGNVMAAAWAAARGAYESANGLHRSAAVYRSGLELVASSVTCANGTTFQSGNDSVWAAVDCLGLPHDSIKRAPTELQGEAMNFKVSRDAFHALMLIARTSCVKLPLSSDPDVAKQLERRQAACSNVVFKPKHRPVTLDPTDSASNSSAPAPAPAPPPAPEPEGNDNGGH